MRAPKAPRLARHSCFGLRGWVRLSEREGLTLLTSEHNVGVFTEAPPSGRSTRSALGGRRTFARTLACHVVVFVARLENLPAKI